MPGVNGRLSRRQGFTIIELLIVVIVIGVLAAAGIGKYQGFAENARTKTCCSNSALIETGAAMWCTQNTALSDTNVQGACYFRRDGHSGAWMGTPPPFGNGGVAGWGVANIIRDPKVFMCPRILQVMAGGVVNNYPADTGGWACGWRDYLYYYNAPQAGGWANGAQPYWYDSAGINTAHQIVWCSAYGGYNCDNWDPTLRKYLHARSWALY
jgi:prepilin-type N-terminal cleavage/methylation domain-containing protein